MKCIKDFRAKETIELIDFCLTAILGFLLVTTLALLLIYLWNVP